MRFALHHAAAAAFLVTGLVAGAWGQMQAPSDSTAQNGTQPGDVMHHDMNGMRTDNGSHDDMNGSRHDMNGSRHGSTGTRHVNRHADNATFPRGLRQCADMADREERARCAGDLYDENGQPRR